MNEIFFKEMKRLRQEMDDAFNKFLSTPKRIPKITPGKDVELFQHPIANVVEREKDVLVRAEMPGLRKEDITINFKDGMLELSGEFKTKHKEDKKGYSMQERTYNGFHRLLRLPTQVKVENANAKYEHGILTVTLPKEHPEMKKLGYKIKLQ